MSDRYTRKDAEAAFARLASALGKTWSDQHGKLWKGSYWEPMPLLRENGEPARLWTRTTEQEGARADQYKVRNIAAVGVWTLDYNPAYGGFVIEEMYNEGGGVSQPFGSMRRNAREFCDVVYFAENALRAAKVTA